MTKDVMLDDLLKNLRRAFPQRNWDPLDRDQRIEDLAFSAGHQAVIRYIERELAATQVR